MSKSFLKRPFYAFVLTLWAFSPAMADQSSANPPPFKDQGTPEEFVRDIYQRYAGGDSVEPQLQGRDAKALASPALLALIRKDQKIANGEAGAFDSDPLCSCQDSEGMKVDGIVMHERGASLANAEIRLRFPQSGNQRISIDVSLVRSDGKWRVDDVIDRKNNQDFATILRKDASLPQVSALKAR